ncbi:hypothetical protein CORC01_09311 [Colletotrichum orchidophilum]|uniref:Uncharacterized protein n=2 Tax=Colletotrichum TaxID=5455 RepID=A0A1G4B1X8_9PEZI|nr:uncharacterized protein CORC01_09311 [Colletotrichum orchidophilum]XP_060431790.1 uncharacterized protein BDP55DRAFT_658597 [Colletotrichum godetiae]KAK1688095.1 hypothetical protein BDP55DRAFT_658597 [Colletotrichum godetiae]OHE95439.1 hypothetical protein CORC01_09311 [Colletotrichum orchidophilum]
MSPSTMPARQDAYSVSIPISPPPPSDLSTYMRSMHQHTKRQMEAANRSSTRRSGGRTSYPSINGHHSSSSHDSSY